MVKTFKIEGNLGYWGLHWAQTYPSNAIQIDKPTPRRDDGAIVQGTVPAIIAIAGLFSPSEFVLTRLRLSFTVGRLRRWKRWALSGCGAGDIISTSPREIISKSSPYFYGWDSIHPRNGRFMMLFATSFSSSPFLIWGFFSPLFTIIN